MLKKIILISCLLAGCNKYNNEYHTGCNSSSVDKASHHNIECDRGATIVMKDNWVICQCPNDSIQTTDAGQIQFNSGK